MMPQRRRKSKNSLNECMYRDLMILQDILSMLLRFRPHPVALVADKEKAFYR